MNPKPTKAAHIEDLMEIVRKRIQEDKSQSRGGPGSSILNISDFSLSEDIMSYRFSKKFMILIFDYYTEVTDPVQHLLAYQLKMAVHSHDDLIVGCFLLVLKAWRWTGSTRFRYGPSQTLRKSAISSITNMPRDRSLRRTIIIFSRSRCSRGNP